VIPDASDKVLIASEPTSKAAFSISSKAQAHIMTILRSTLYTDKVLAVLREYSSNAWDSHRLSGKADVPIKVVLPTEMEPELVIRDFGDGMSEEQMYEVFTKYGESTKRESNEAVGMLGIGSKSGFAYSDSFMVTSWNGGAKKVYTAVLDATNVGDLRKLHEEPCGDETGVEIRIPVRINDIYKFERTAQRLFATFVPPPDINTHLERDVPIFRCEEGSLGNGRGSWTAVMGCVPYKMDIGQIVGFHPGEEDGDESEQAPTRGLLDDEDTEAAIRRLHGTLFFDIGAVDISASREELEYSDRTKAALVRSLAVVVDKYVDQSLHMLDDPTISSWDKRRKARDFQNTIGIKLDSHADWVVSSVRLLDDDQPDNSGDGEGDDERGHTKVKALTLDTFMKPPKCGEARTFAFCRYVGNEHDRYSYRSKRKDGKRRQARKYWVATNAINVESPRRIVIVDDKRTLKWFGLSPSTDYLVRPNNGEALAVVQAELNERVIAARLDGIPVALLSTLPYEEPEHGPGPKANQKHMRRFFRLANPDARGKMSSNDWEVVERKPSSDDVFVIIERFTPVGNDDFCRMVRDDLVAAKRLGVAGWPDIYAYKTTETKPIKPEECTGTHYNDWRVSLFKKLSEEPAMQRAIVDHDWAQILNLDYDKLLVAFRFIAHNLGTDSPIHKAYTKMVIAAKRLRRGGYSAKVIDGLKARLPTRESVAKSCLDEMNKRYPLLEECKAGISLFAEESEARAKWMDYIRLVDRDRARSKPEIKPAPELAPEKEAA